MTNGEKMQEVFPEGKTRKCRDGVVFESDGWCHAYDSGWWNAEYKEPTTKNDLGVDCISRKAVFETIDDCNSDGLKGIFCSYDDGEKFKEYIKNLPPVTPQEPKPMVEIDLYSVIKQKYIEREVLDKIRAEIETKYGQCKLTEYIVQYDGICTSANDIGNIADILQIIDKYKAESEGKE